MDDLGKTVAAHNVTLTQMHERLGRIEARLASLEARLAGLERRLLYGGGVLGLLMSVYTLL
jgi:type II secretory pathway component PulM